MLRDRGSEMVESDVSRDDFFWILQGLCTVHCKPFSLPIAQQQLATPYSITSLVLACKAYGMEASTIRVAMKKLPGQSFPLIAWLKEDVADRSERQAGDRVPTLTPALLLRADSLAVMVLDRQNAAPATLTVEQFSARYCGHVTRVLPAVQRCPDADSQAQASRSRQFGFSWFFAEILKYRKLGQEILLASLVIQLVGLATPLFTQTIIDKVVVHRQPEWRYRQRHLCLRPGRRRRHRY